MNLISLIVVFLKISIFLTVFGLGLRAALGDVIFLFRRPRLLLRSLLSINVIVPLFAIFLALAFHLTPAVSIALVLLAFSPLPPLIPRKELKLGGSPGYVFGLLVTVSLFSIVIMPLGLNLLGIAMGREVWIEPIEIAKVVSLSVLIPLLAGALVRYFSESFADRAARIISLVAGIMLLVGVIPILYFSGSSMISLIGNGTLLAMAAVVVGGLISGHLLGGPNFGDRSTLAIASATRHPGIALMAARAIFPDQTKEVMAAILLYFIVNIVVSLPYVAWCKKHRPAATAAA